MQEVNSIELDPVKRENRILKARWSMEMQQDLRAVHNINAEKALTDLMAKELQEEIDREIIKDLANEINSAIRSDAHRNLTAHKEVTLVPPQHRSIDDKWEPSWIS